MTEGVFQTDRAIFDNPIWKNPAKFRLFFYIYGNAIFAKDGISIAGIHLTRGQLLKSYRALADDLEYLENHSLKKYSISHIKKLIGELVLEKRLEVEVVQLGTVFTVLNYEQYQGFERFEKGKIPEKNTCSSPSEQRTEKEQLETSDTNDQTPTENTNRERIENALRTEQEQNENNNNNVKKEKKEKKVLGIYGDTQFKPPTIEEVKEYCLERNNDVDANKWHDFYSSKGWMVGKNKMKDWKAAVRTWEHKDKQGGQAFNQKPNRPKSFDAIDQWDKMTEGLIK